VTADAETRAEVLAEIRQVLTLLKGRAAEPPALPPQAAAYPDAVPWETPPAATPEADLSEALRAHRAGATLTLPEGLAVQHAGPHAPLLGLLHRLAHLLGLSPLEQEFFTACASDQLLDAFDGRLAYADWLEDRGDCLRAMRIRKLTPEAGDLLVYHAAPPLFDGRAWQECHDAAAALRDAVAARGVETAFVVLRPGVSLDRLSETRMAELGWVPAGRVAEEREACAREAERAAARWNAENGSQEAVSEVVAAAVRERGDAPS
jgi:hypothetical protein